MNKKILSSLLLIGLMVGCSTNNASSTSSNNDSTSNITTSSKLNDKSESSSLNSSNTMPKNEITLDSINVFVNKMMPYHDLIKIVSIDIKENILYTESVFKNGSTSYLYKLEHEYPHTLESLEDAIDEEMPDTFIRAYEGISEYNSAKYLLESNEFVGQLEEYRQSGYEVSILSSKTVTDRKTKKGDFFYIYATYKLDNGSDVKYVKSNICCNINNPSTNEQINYTVRLKDPNQRDLREFNFEIISPEAVIFSELMDKYLNKSE